jgi:hypothetical protein
MTELAKMAERHGAALARIAEVAERLAMKHAERALAADDPRVEAVATAAFQKATRVMRQSMALEARLARDVQQADRDTISREARETIFQVHHRRSQIAATTERLIRTEVEDPDHAERLCNELDDLLDIEAFTDGFLTQDLATQITRLCKDLGIKGVEVLAILPDAPPQSAHPREGGDPGFFR